MIRVPLFSFCAALFSFCARVRVICAAVLIAARLFLCPAHRKLPPRSRNDGLRNESVSLRSCWIETFACFLEAKRVEHALRRVIFARGACFIEPRNGTTRCTTSTPLCGPGKAQARGGYFSWIRLLLVTGVCFSTSLPRDGRAGHRSHARTAATSATLIRKRTIARESLFLKTSSSTADPTGRRSHYR